MEESNLLCVEVCSTSEGIEHAPDGSSTPDPPRHRMDREVPAAEVVFDRGRADHDRQAGRRRIFLAASRRDIDAKASGGAERRGPEASVRLLERPAGQKAEARRELQGACRSRFHSQIDVSKRPPEKEVAERASDEPQPHVAPMRNLARARELGADLFRVERGNGRAASVHEGAG